MKAEAHVAPAEAPAAPTSCVVPVRRTPARASAPSSSSPRRALLGGSITPPVSTWRHQRRARRGVCVAARRRAAGPACRAGSCPRAGKQQTVGDPWQATPHERSDASTRNANGRVRRPPGVQQRRVALTRHVSGHMLWAWGRWCSATMSGTRKRPQRTSKSTESPSSKPPRPFRIHMPPTSTPARPRKNGSPPSASPLRSDCSSSSTSNADNVTASSAPASPQPPKRPSTPKPEEAIYAKG